MVRAWSAMARVMAWRIPPGGVRGELVALRVVELLDSADEAQVAFLDEVEEQHPASHVALGDGHHQAQVGLDERLLGVYSHLFDARKTPLVAPGKLDAFLVGVVEFLGCLYAGLDLHGQVDLFGRGQQRNLAYLLEIHAHRDLP